MLRRPLSFLLGTLLSCASPALFAQEPGAVVPSTGAEAPPPERREVVIGITGSLDPDARATLVRLLRAELEPHGLGLVEDDPTGETRSWARDATRGDARLLVVLLDTTNDAGFRLVVIDAARGRAISRELPGGSKNAANVEAIVSIVISATNALHEGLEVASAPLEAIVGPAPARSAAPPPEAPKAVRSEPEPERGTSLHASATAVVASLSEAAEPTFGGSLALGASIASFLDIDVGGAAHAPGTITSDLGSFELGRTSLALRAGPVLRTGAFTFVPTLGASTEWLSRSETRAAGGVTPSDDTETIARFGGELTLRARYTLVGAAGSERLSVLGTLGGSYYGNEVRFLAGDELLASARQAVFDAGLGVFIATDPL